MNEAEWRIMEIEEGGLGYNTLRNLHNSSYDIHSK